MSTPQPPTIRTVAHPWIRWAGRRLGELNARHPWNHNAHFHRWILRSLPREAPRVLDVGCGEGDLVAALRATSARVDGIDPDPTMAYRAASRFRDDRGVRIARRAFDELADDPELPAAYDAITMVASLHHQDLDPALELAARLLRPGGRLLVVTLVQPVTPLDHAWDVADALTNPLIGLVKHPRPVRADRALTAEGAAADATAADQAMPVKDPGFSTGHLRARAAELLPGARIRRREGFRVTLRWERPGA